MSEEPQAPVIARWLEAISAQMSGGKSKSEAIDAVATENPALHLEYLAGVTPSHGSSGKMAPPNWSKESI